jgi:hypothetical protein
MAQTDSLKRENRYSGVSISPEELLQRKGTNRPVWEMVLEVMRDVPREEIEQLPTDGSEQHDHYIYGSPKKS